LRGLEAQVEPIMNASVPKLFGKRRAQLRNSTMMAQAARDAVVANELLAQAGVHPGINVGWSEAIQYLAQGSQAQNSRATLGGASGALEAACILTRMYEKPMFDAGARAYAGELVNRPIEQLTPQMFKDLHELIEHEPVVKESFPALASLNDVEMKGLANGEAVLGTAEALSGARLQMFPAVPEVEMQPSITDMTGAGSFLDAVTSTLDAMAAAPQLSVEPTASLVKETRDLIELNRARINGQTPAGAVQGYSIYPDQAELGTIKSNLEFLQVAAQHAPQGSAPVATSSEIVSW
jgi:hypothetical protein